MKKQAVSRSDVKRPRKPWKSVAVSALVAASIVLACGPCESSTNQLCTKTLMAIASSLLLTDHETTVPSTNLEKVNISPIIGHYQHPNAMKTENKPKALISSYSSSDYEKGYQVKKSSIIRPANTHQHANTASIWTCNHVPSATSDGHTITQYCLMSHSQTLNPTPRTETPSDIHPSPWRKPGAMDSSTLEK